MPDQTVAKALDRAEAALSRGAGLKGTGFWRAVGRMRREPQLAREFGRRAGDIDRRAFEAGVKLRVPAAVGTAILTAGTLKGIALMAGASYISNQLLRTLIFLSGVLALLISTHSLAHWIVGRFMGMKFTHYFLGGPPPPRPGIKVDYATYLAVAPRRRALMHASGAVVTKAIPFLAIPAGTAVNVSPWALFGLAGIGLLQIVTDALFSTKTSDWKKVRRELRAGVPTDAN